MDTDEDDEDPPPGVTHDQDDDEDDPSFAADRDHEVNDYRHGYDDDEDIDNEDMFDPIEADELDDPHDDTVVAGPRHARVPAPVQPNDAHTDTTDDDDSDDDEPEGNPVDIRRSTRTTSKPVRLGFDAEPSLAQVKECKPKECDSKECSSKECGSKECKSACKLGTMLPSDAFHGRRLSSVTPSFLMACPRLETRSRKSSIHLPQPK